MEVAEATIAATAVATVAVAVATVADTAADVIAAMVMVDLVTLGVEVATMAIGGIRSVCEGWFLVFCCGFA
uniref:Uncharacterized protein n=1 Tax=Rhizophora mucronata TaxID=61149 RepID=A0A2P2Q3V3_RHIMU